MLQPGELVRKTCESMGAWVWRAWEKERGTESGALPSGATKHLGICSDWHRSDPLRIKQGRDGCIGKLPCTHSPTPPLTYSIPSIVPDRPSILKYLYEEPTLLPEEPPPSGTRRRKPRSEPPEDFSTAFEEASDDPGVHRGYLAGTNRTDETVGLTSIRPTEAYIAPLLEALGQSWWGRCTTDKTTETLSVETVRRILRMPPRTSVLVTAETPVVPERMTAVAGRARRRDRSALRPLLDAAHVVFFPEPARDGHDWSFFSTAPMRDRLVAAFRAHPSDAVRRFVLPYQKARSESKFHFDTWQLTEPTLPDYIEEV